MRTSIGRGLLTGLGLIAILCATAALPGSAARATTRCMSHAGIKTGGTVTISYGPHGSFTRNFNPLAGNPADGTTAFIYEPLLMFNQLSGKVTPWLANGYRWSNGNKTLTFSLRPGVKWNDGKPFTSADVKFSVGLAKTNAGDCMRQLLELPVQHQHAEHNHRHFQLQDREHHDAVLSRQLRPGAPARVRQRQGP